MIELAIRRRILANPDIGPQFAQYQFGSTPADKGPALFRTPIIPEDAEHICGTIEAGASTVSGATLYVDGDITGRVRLYEDRNRNDNRMQKLAWAIFNQLHRSVLDDYLAEFGWGGLCVASFPQYLGLDPNGFPGYIVNFKATIGKGLEE